MNARTELEKTFFADTRSAEQVLELLNRVSSKGMRLWLEGEQLRFRAPEGAITAEELSELRQVRRQVLEYLRAGAESTHLEHAHIVRRLNRVPASFSQLQHWNFYRLADRPAMRHLASATRLRGPLNVSMLRRSIDTIVPRHEALQTQVVLENGALLQKIDREASRPMRMVDLSVMPEAQHEREVQQIIEAMIHEPIDPAVGPLFETCLLTIAEDHHVLIVVMEHLVSDMWSLDLVLQEIFTVYSQLIADRPIALPPVRLQFSDYASWQRRQEAAWLETHGEYWAKRLAGCARLRFPLDPSVNRQEAVDVWDMVPSSISAERAAQINEWCQANGTTPALAVFTAYAVLVLRWCNVRDGVIRFETNGRSSPEVENTVGYFAAPLYLRVQVREGDALLDVSRRVMDEFCAANDHADSSFLEAGLPRPEFSRNTSFNWVPPCAQEATIRAVAQSVGLECSSVPFENPLLSHGDRDTDPFVLFGSDALGTLGHTPSDAADNGIAGGIYFPLSRFSRATMQRFAADFSALIDQLVR